MPAILFFALFYYFPIVYAGTMSFFRWKIVGTPQFLGIQNYISILFKSTTFRSAFKNTVVFTFWYVIANIIFSLGIAMLINSLSKVVGVFLRIVSFLPVVASMVGISFTWKWLFEPTHGLINHILGYIGLGPYGWLKSPDMALGSVILVSVWKQVGFFTIIFLAGLQTIPVMYYESAKIDGASPFRCFWNITLPLLRPTIALQIVIATIGGFKTFTQIFVLTEGGPGGSTMTTSMYIYKTGFMLLQMGKASAVAFIVSIVIITLAIIQYRAISREY